MVQGDATRISGRKLVAKIIPNGWCRLALLTIKKWGSDRRFLDNLETCFF
jgi:hypothetical protein